jgi:hypothetical protein
MMLAQRLFSMRMTLKYVYRVMPIYGALTDGTQEIRLYTSGLESAKKAAKTIVLFLTQRSVVLVIIYAGSSHIVLKVREGQGDQEFQRS